MMCLAFVTWWLVRDLGPEGMPGGFRRPRPTRLAQQLGTLEPPGDPGRLPAAFRHGRHPRIFLACLGRRVALSLFTTGHQAARGQDGPGAWESIQQGEAGRRLGPWRTSGVEVGKALQGDAALGHERLHEPGVGGEDACSRGQGHSALDGRNTGRDDGGGADVGGRKQRSRGVRRASCAAFSVGQWLRKSPKIAVSLS